MSGFMDLIPAIFKSAPKVASYTKTGAPIYGTVTKAGGSLLKGWTKSDLLRAGTIGTGILGAGALMTAAGGMMRWSGQNVEQTHIISEDAARQLAYQRDRLDFEQDQFEAEQYARDEDYYRSLEQTGIIAGFDQQGRQFQANQQQAQMNFDAQMFQAKQQQIIDDRNRFLQNQAFNTYQKQYNAKPTDQATLGYILSELQLIFAEQNKGQFANEAIAPEISDDFYPEEEEYY